MSTTTSNLGLFKYDVNTDTNVAFSITKALNNNWDIIDEKCNGGGLEICDIGIALYVDETKGLRRYLNGQVVDRNTNTQAFLDRLKQITTLHPSLLCTEDEWQSAKTLSAFGQVGKFVFNYNGADIVSVRLPRVVNVQGLFDLQNLGMTVSAGLPNITGQFGHANSTTGGNAKGAISTIAAVGLGNSFTQSTANNTQFYAINASLSNLIYGNSDTVQQEAIQYPYFIQIATGSETEANITNKFENTNPQTLLESKYSDKPLYNESWLLSNGQYNLKATYPTAYEGLQVEYNTEIEAGTTVTLPSGVSYTKRGLSVKLSTEDYTDYDFVLNTADETFRLPLKTKLASGNAVVGNGMALGLTNGTDNMAISQANSPDLNYSISAGLDGYGTPVGSEPGLVNITQVNKTIGLTTDPTKSGIETSDQDLYLYFYVGETVQNANLIDAGRIGEQLANKADISTPSIQAPYIKDTYQNGTSGYRIWSNGYCEQWGRMSGTSVTYLKQFKDTNYNLIMNYRDYNADGAYGSNYSLTSSTTGFTKKDSGTPIEWKACGYLADGEY